MDNKPKSTFVLLSKKEEEEYEEKSHIPCNSNIEFITNIYDDDNILEEMYLPIINNTKPTRQSEKSKQVPDLHTSCNCRGQALNNKLLLSIKHDINIIKRDINTIKRDINNIKLRK